MCVATSFKESASLTGLPASLVAALAQMHASPGPSFCSNPFIEQGVGNARTNCIGCHQHGGTNLETEQILADEARFPGNSRWQTRNNFPADYTWQTSRGSLGLMFSDELRHFSQDGP